MADTTATMVTNDMRGKDPNMPQEVERTISRVIRQVVREEGQWFTDRMVRLYDAHFTHSEIRELISFYSSPVGRKYGANLQSITLEALRIGQEFNQHVQPRLQQVLLNELEKVVQE